MSLDNLKLPKENLFKITCRDRHDNPNYTFTWELTPEGSAILQENEVRFPFVYVLALEEIPAKRVETHTEGCGCNRCIGFNEVIGEKLFCLHEGAGQIQFYRQGTFRIYVMIIWHHVWCLNDSWRKNRQEISNYLYRYREPIVSELKRVILPRAMGWLEHIEEDAVHISGSFFAKPPNPILWWWANLWWSEEPANTCDYRKRLWFVLWIQLITVSTYVLLRGLLMTLGYLVLLLTGYRPSALSIRPMFHPFSSKFSQLCDFETRTSSYALYNSNGERRELKEVLVRIPALWILVPVLLYVSADSIYHHPKYWLRALTTIASTVVLGCLGYLIRHLVSWMKPRKSPIVRYYEQIPVKKPKVPRVAVRIRWLDAKGKLCLPFAK